jgi:hypothetical protein
MKTKHILTAMVLPAMLAACTADEIVENNNVANIQGRALLNPMTITVNGAESRANWSDQGYGKFVWDAENDKFSAFMLDVDGVKGANDVNKQFSRSDHSAAYNMHQSFAAFVEGQSQSVYTKQFHPSGHLYNAWYNAIKHHRHQHGTNRQRHERPLGICVGHLLEVVHQDNSWNGKKVEQVGTNTQAH